MLACNIFQFIFYQTSETADIALLSAGGNAMHRHGLWHKNHMKSIGPLWDILCLTQISDRPSSVTSWNVIQGLWVVYSLEWHWGPAVSVVNLLSTRWLLTCQPVNIHVNLTPFLSFSIISLLKIFLWSFFMRRILLDFLTLWPCYTVGLSAGIECVNPHIHTQNISQTHATDLFLVNLLLSKSYISKILLYLTSLFSKLACGIWFLY